MTAPASQAVAAQKQHASRKRRPEGLPLADARAAAPRFDWRAAPPAVPRFLGTRTIGPVPLADLVRYIDWMPFFNAWEFPGKFPEILEDPVRGVAASALWKDAQAMLGTLVREHWLTAQGVVGLFPAAAEGDDIVVYADPARSARLDTLHHLRQQKVKPAGQAQLCLSDYVAPEGSGVDDYVGAFAVTAGIGIEAPVLRFEAAHDDYSAILLKALADRFAEALAEALHERVRREFWGYAPDERLTGEALVREEYRGIRPAPGYPACPDHSEKAALWRLLDTGQAAGIRLTESYAMYPAASVSGWYFAHPEARYFAVGPIGVDQLESYARRKGIPVAEARRWLAPLLGQSEADAA